MEDVIFAGTAGRPPLGRAEVTLTIDNSDNALPIDYTEVSITRRMFREGTSEYEINGEPARLLDIQELLSDSGIGREMHVIVGQGQLDAVLSARPEDRRGFIEEAAGVLKHRKRKEKALRKLDAMQANLTRLTDLTAELRRQLKPLGKQAEIARRARACRPSCATRGCGCSPTTSLRLRAELAREVADEEAIRARRGRGRGGARRRPAQPRGRARGPASPPTRRAVAARPGDLVPARRRCEERFRGTASLAAERGAAPGGRARGRRVAGRDPEAMEAEAAEVRAEEEATAARSWPTRRRRWPSARRPRGRTSNAGSPPPSAALVAAARAVADRREGLAKLAGQVNALRTRAAARPETRSPGSPPRRPTPASGPRGAAARARRGCRPRSARWTRASSGLDERHEARGRRATRRSQARGPRARRGRARGGARPLDLGGARRRARGGPDPQGRRRRAARRRRRGCPACSARSPRLLTSSRATRPRSPPRSAPRPTPSRSPRPAPPPPRWSCSKADGRRPGRTARRRRRRPAGPDPAAGGRCRPARAGRSTWSTRPTPLRGGGRPRCSTEVAVVARPGRRGAARVDRHSRTSAPSPATGDVLGARLVDRRLGVARRARIEIQAAVDEARPEAGEAAAPARAAARRARRGARGRATAPQAEVDTALAALHESDAQLSAVAERLAELGQQAHARPTAEADRLDEAPRRGRAGPRRRPGRAGRARGAAAPGRGRSPTSRRARHQRARRAARRGRRGPAGRDGGPARGAHRRGAGARASPDAPSSCCARPRPSGPPAQRQRSGPRRARPRRGGRRGGPRRRASRCSPGSRDRWPRRAAERDAAAGRAVSPRGRAACALRAPDPRARATSWPGSPTPCTATRCCAPSSGCASSSWRPAPSTSSASRSRRWSPSTDPTSPARRRRSRSPSTSRHASAARRSSRRSPARTTGRRRRSGPPAPSATSPCSAR